MTDRGRADQQDPRGQQSQRDQRGQTTVEVVLVLPVVVLLVLAVVQVGLVVRDRILLVHAVREGARVAAVEPEQVRASAAATGATPLDPRRLVVIVDGGTEPGDRLTVTGRYRSATELPLVGPLVPDVDMTARVTVRVE